jgi:hypothetical protein
MRPNESWVVDQIIEIHNAFLQQPADLPQNALFRRERRSLYGLLSRRYSRHGRVHAHKNSGSRPLRTAKGHVFR